MCRFYGAWFDVYVRARRSPVETVQRPDSEQTREGDTTMRFMVLVKADKDTEAGVLPASSC